MVFMATAVIAQEVSKTDPYHQKTGGFGYLIVDRVVLSGRRKPTRYESTMLPKNKDV